MFNTGKMDVGCGVFDYKLEDPASITPIDKTEERICWNQADYPGHADTSWGGVYDTYFSFCSTLIFGVVDGRKAWDSTLFYSNFEKMHESSAVFSDSKGVHYSYSVFWKEGCNTADGTQSAGFPTIPEVSTLLNCWSIQLDIWKQCKYETVSR